MKNYTYTLNEGFNSYFKKLDEDFNSHREQLLQELEEIDPFDEYTEAAEYFNDLVQEAEEEEGWFSEPSGQGSIWSMYIYTDDDNEIKIKGSVFDRNLCNIASNATNEDDFKNKYKQYIEKHLKKNKSLKESSNFTKLESKKLLEEEDPFAVKFTDDFDPDIWYKNAKHDYQLFKKNGYVLGLKEKGNKTPPTPVSFPKSFAELKAHETSEDSYLLYRKEFSSTVETRVAFLDFPGLFYRKVSNIPEYVGTYANRGHAATHTYSYGDVETFLSKLDKKANKAAGIKDYPDYHLLTKHGRSFLMNKKEVEALERLIRRIAGNDYSRKISSGDFSDIYARVYQATTDESDPNYRKVFVPDFWQYLSDSDLKRFMRGHGWENIESDEVDESLLEESTAGDASKVEISGGDGKNVFYFYVGPSYKHNSVENIIAFAQENLDSCRGKSPEEIEAEHMFWGTDSAQFEGFYNGDTFILFDDINKLSPDIKQDALRYCKKPLAEAASKKASTDHKWGDKSVKSQLALPENQAKLNSFLKPGRDWKEMRKEFVDLINSLDCTDKNKKQTVMKINGVRNEGAFYSTVATYMTGIKTESVKLQKRHQQKNLKF